MGIDLPSSEKAVELACSHPQIFAAIGVHPHDVENIDNKSYSFLRKLYASAPQRIKAYGEIGLDYFKNYSPHSVQRKEFAAQLELARELQLPVIIHNRDADNDCYDILKSFPLRQGAIMHCFGSDYSFAKKVLELGLYISFSGVVTFKNAADLHTVAANIPLDRMLVETDGPFLAPVPFRGKRNEPAHTRHTAARIAELRGISIEEVASATTRNAKKIFTLP
ncbi:MAG: hydrolase TatD [Deltaproteobacteria bacterium]|nr:MAG: hydrolase TatD [Deltaproteobacteria bacterium]